MAADDYAILVGISRYRDSDKYPTLDGPLNDVERVWTWLTDKVTGGQVPEDNIKRLTTPEALLQLPKVGWPKETEWVPNREAFSKLFRQVALDDTGEFVRRNGRLYLYFSGHGFSQLADEVTRAALYSADNYGKAHTNLAGTLYADAVRRAKLFKEVVLLMDCCRDVESNYVYNIPDINKVENDGSETVKLFAMYAAPKRGKAQERELQEADGKVVGLMTNAWLRALEEAPCDVAGRVSGKLINNFVGFNWKAWYPKLTPPTPRVVPPEDGDVYFSSRKALVEQKFQIRADMPVNAVLRLNSPTFAAKGEVSDQTIIWRDLAYTWVAEIPLETGAHPLDPIFSLKLPPGELHSFGVNGNMTEFKPGAQDVVRY